MLVNESVCLCMYFCLSVTLKYASCKLICMNASGLTRSFLIRPFPNSLKGNTWQSTSSASAWATASELHT